MWSVLLLNNCPKVSTNSFHVFKQSAHIVENDNINRSNCENRQLILLKHCFLIPIKFTLSSNQLMLWYSNTKRLKGLWLELVANEVAFEPSKKEQKRKFSKISKNYSLVAKHFSFYYAILKYTLVWFDKKSIAQQLLQRLSHQKIKGLRCQNLSVLFSTS